MKYKLLAIDLDGTLLNSQSEISAANKQAIGDAIDKGLNTIICSGRSQSSVAYFNKELRLDKKGSYGISFNGGVVYNARTSEVLYESRLKKEHAINIIKQIKSMHPSTPIIVYFEEDLIYYEYEDENIVLYSNKVNIRRVMVESLEDSINKDVLKLIIRWTPKLLAEIVENVSAKVSDYATIVYSGENLLEFASKDCNKLQGLKFLCSHLGIDLDDVAAIGDYNNDYEMIKNVGFGAAVNNASPLVKKVAKYITNSDNNNNAVKEFIEILLNEAP